MIYDTLEYTDVSSVKHEVAIALDNIGGAAGIVAMNFVPANNHAPGTLTLQWAQPPETGIDIPYKSPCIIRVCRTSTDGSPDSFSGGTILFQGRRTDNSGSRHSNRVRSGITLMDVLGDLGLITYQQPSNQITGGTIASPTFTPFYWPDVVLFQAFNGITYTPSPVYGTITTWQQMMDVLDYGLGFIASGTDKLNFQYSTTPEFTPHYRNWDSQRSVKCLAAVESCMRSHPGVFRHVDHTTLDGSSNPCPTIHFRNRGSMTALTLPYIGIDANGNSAQATEIQSLDQIVPDNVRIYYRINGTFNGQPVSSPYVDAYPANANALNNLDFSVDIAGASKVQMAKDFSSTPLDPTSKDLWRLKVAALHQIVQGGQIPNDGDSGNLAFISTSPYDATTNPKGIQVLGDDGTDYSNSYTSLIPYWTDDNIYSWFQLAAGSVTVKKVTVKAFFSYYKKGAGGSEDRIKEHQHTMRLTLCSIPTGRYISPVITTSAGESVPANLAQSIYTELQDLQWRFSHQVLQVASSPTAVPTVIQPGLHKINLSGGKTEWTTMNAVPEHVAINIRRNANNCLVFYTKLTCGPRDIRDAATMVSLANVFWLRGRANVDKESRLSGATAGGSVDLSLNAASKENSVPNLPFLEVYNLGGADAVDATRTNVYKFDAPAGQVSLLQQKTSDNTLYTTGLITPEYSGAGAPTSSTLPANTYYRVGDKYFDNTANSLYRCTTAGSNSGSVWVEISSGSSGSIFADFYDGTGGTAYSSGAIVQVLTTTTLSGITILPGTYVLRDGLSTPTSPSGNQIPQYPYPTSGTIYWINISMGISVANVCAAGGSGQVYINSSDSF